MMTRVGLLSLCCHADELETEERCGRGFECRRIRVGRIVVVRDDRHLIVGVPSSIAGIVSQSLE